MRKYLLMAFAAMMSTVSINAQHEEGDITIQPRVGITLSNLSGIDDAKMKVNAQIRGEEVRVSSKSIDDLQECIKLVKSLNLELPISFRNLK